MAVRAYFFPNTNISFTEFFSTILYSLTFILNCYCLLHTLLSTLRQATQYETQLKVSAATHFRVFRSEVKRYLSKCLPEVSSIRMYCGI